MKTIELPIKRGDRVWVKVYNERNGSFTSRMAEVISILQMYVSGGRCTVCSIALSGRPQLWMYSL